MSIITDDDIRVELDAMHDEPDEPMPIHHEPRNLGARLTLYGVFYANHVKYALDEGLVGIYDSESVARRVADYMQSSDDEGMDVEYFVCPLQVGERPELQMTWVYYE